MNQTKIALSQKERELVTNADWILTKNGIIKKVWQLFEQLQEKQAAILQAEKATLPAEIFSVSPKISKGENYKGLPYLILDQPRWFDKNNILAIRSLFWWGNFFSSTLHLAGRYKTLYEEKMLQSYAHLCQKEFFICVHPEQWEHDFAENNYQETSALTAANFEQVIRSNSFIKIARKISLENWDDAEELLAGNFGDLVGLLH